jgi:hypothetical protein
MMSLEDILQLVVIIVFFYWNVAEGAVFENSYPQAFVKLYLSPLWHFILVLLVIAGGIWCPTVAAMVALAVFFYNLDFESISLLNSVQIST